MSLSYHYSFAAPASVTPGQLESFLKGVERYAKTLGFGPTTVLNVVFDNKERRDFSRRLGGGVYIEKEKLKGVALPSAEDATSHNAEAGCCRVVPRQGLVLVITDERGCETCFGFLKYPSTIRDMNGKPIVETGTGDQWVYRNFVDTPDRRYRQIVKRFAVAGYLKNEDDEYAQG